MRNGMKNETSITALMSAFGRAYHAKQAEKPIFADTKARELMLSECCFLVYEHLKRGQIQSRYFSGRTDWLSAFEHICYAHAVSKK